MFPIQHHLKLAPAIDKASVVDAAAVEVRHNYASTFNDKHLLTHLKWLKMAIYHFAAQFVEQLSLSHLYFDIPRKNPALAIAPNR